MRTAHLTAVHMFMHRIYAAFLPAFVHDIMDARRTMLIMPANAPISKSSVSMPPESHAELGHRTEEQLVADDRQHVGSLE